MGGKSIASRAANRKQRQKMHMSKYSFSKLMVRPENMMEERDIEIAPPSREEMKCLSCGFKARYKFFRCPECNEIQR
ncbi:MAG: hypothetical protein HYW26_01385 [Candidatus Aenigmarchaeota archaeon]|nr:hypothetical protein [Candidatus Aenigmarchaeota archaeon]